MPKLEQQWFALLAFCAAILTPMPTLAATPIYLSEIAWAGSSLSASDEWIELTNPSNETINLSGWKITGAGGRKQCTYISRRIQRSTSFNIPDWKLCNRT